MRVELRWFGAIVLAVGFVWSTTRLIAQESGKATASSTETNPAVPAPGHSLHGEAFNDGPRQHAYLMAGQGKVHFPVDDQQARSPGVHRPGSRPAPYLLLLRVGAVVPRGRQARPVVCHGLLGHGHVEREQPQAGPRVSSRRLASARRTISRRETLYLDALEAFFKETGNDKERRQNLLLGLETIVQEFPDDLDARAWLAMVTWQNSDKDGIGSRQAVDGLIETVLEQEPMHPGATTTGFTSGTASSRSAPNARPGSTPRPPRASPTPGTCRDTPTPG